MFGGGGKKNGRHIPYYVCSKRFTQHECDQDYVRAEILETAIIQDIKTIFRDEQFMARIWEEANKRLANERPDLDKEIEQIEDRAVEVRSRIDRYSEAFETGALKPEIFGEKVEELNARLEQLRAEKRALEARREIVGGVVLGREIEKQHV